MGTVKYTGPVASFHCPTNAEIRSLKVHFSPKQLGEGDPSPENVRPIEGWDGIEIYRNSSTTDYEFGVLGKNKLNPNGNWVVGALYRYMYIPECTSKCILSFTEKDSSIDLSDIYLGFGYDEPTSFVNMNKGYRWCIQNGTLANVEKINTVLTGDNSNLRGELCKYLVIYPSTDETLNKIFTKYNIQLELGSTATAYEPYDPNHTVYGGWVDLISGEVQEEYILLNKSWSEWENSTTFEDGTELRYINFGTPVKGNGVSNFKTSLCNVAKYVYGNNNGKIHYYIVGNSYNCRVYLPIGTNEDTQIQILGELVTPISYSLTPTQLQTFLGQNNIWSNADYVEVEYDLHETQNILARKQFIIANQPHIVKPAAAPLQNFVTDVAAPLKECKVYFSPVQDTSNGAPSPDNICPISGWTGLEVTKCRKNLFNKNDVESGYISAVTTSTRQLGEIISNNDWRTSNYILVAPSTTYTLSMPNQGNASVAGLVMYSDKEVGKEINGFSLMTMKISTNYYYTFTTPSNCYYIRFAMSYSIIDTIQLELGSTATEYEPYTGTTLPIDWTTEAGTVYGGYVDLVTGEVVQEYELTADTWGNIKYSSINSTTGYQYGRLFFNNPVVKAGTPESKKVSYCNVGIYTWNLTDNATSHFYIHTLGDTETYTAYITLPSTTDDNLLITCVGKLINPITYQISPTTLKTLRGTNNIWSSANGDIEVKYWTH